MTEPIEVPKKTKAELFAEEPDRFVDCNEILFAISRHPESKILGNFVNIAREGMSITDVYEECLKLKAFADRKLGQFMNGLDLQIAERNKAAQIVKANGKPHFFSRGHR